MHKNRKQKYSLYVERLRNINKSIYLLQSQKHTGFSIMQKISVNSIWLEETAYYYAQKVAKRVSEAVADGSFYFLTLTQKWEKRDLKEKIRIAKWQLQTSIKLLRKKFKNVRYFYSIEYTKRLQPHFHILISPYAAGLQLMNIWKRKTGATQNTLTPAFSKASQKYVIKYLTKFHSLSEKMQEIIFHTISRLWSASRNFFIKIKQYPSCPIWDIWGFLRELPNKMGFYHLQDIFISDFVLELTPKMLASFQKRVNIHITRINKK